MRKIALACLITLALGTTATAVDIAISTRAGWWPQAAADREMQKVVDNVTRATVQVFAPADGLPAPGADEDGAEPQPPRSSP